MAKRQRSVSLSFVLFRFAIVMLGCMFLCCLAWYLTGIRLQKNGVTYPGGVSNQQVEQMLAGEPKTFVSPDEDFLAEYALFDSNGEILESNVAGKKQEELAGFFHESTQKASILSYTYANGDTVVLHWHFRSEFVNPMLRNMLPHAGIQEYDQALDAMGHMQEALYSSLSAQWSAQLEREEEIAALAHDLKTPLTLAGGNAELLMDEELTNHSRKMVNTIVASNERAKQYVASLLEVSAGADEAFENISLHTMFEELCQVTRILAEAKGVCMQTQSTLEGNASIQKERLIRALGNVVQNAIEHTPMGGNVYLNGNMVNGGWQVTVYDEGSGFSKAALKHATERLWRGHAARSADGHNGLGLWFAEQVVKTHAGKLELCNCDSGGKVTIRFCVEHASVSIYH